jgi:hypothetical protein
MPVFAPSSSLSDLGSAAWLDVDVIMQMHMTAVDADLPPIPAAFFPFSTLSQHLPSPWSPAQWHSLKAARLSMQRQCPP